MKDLLNFIVKNIVTNPEDVTVNENIGQSGEITLELRVNPDDIGLVIGKSGKIIKSIRNLIRTKAIIDKKRVNLVLLDQ